MYNVYNLNILLILLKLFSFKQQASEEFQEELY